MRLAPLSGLAGAVLLLAGLSENNVPTSDPDSSIHNWLAAGNTGGWLLHGALSAIAGIVLLLFVFSVRARLVGDRPSIGASLLTTAGALFAGTVFLGGALFAALPIGHIFESSPTPSPDAYRLSMAVAVSLMVVFSMLPAATFAAVTATVGLRRRTMPTWLAILTYVFALLMLASAMLVPFIVFGVWTVITSITLTVTRPRAPAVDSAKPAPAELVPAG